MVEPLTPAALAPAAGDEDRPTRPALRRGLLCRCPACGRGTLFSRYLKVVDRSGDCGTELHHHRADDGPAYLTILIVVHLVGFAFGPMVEGGMAPLTIALVLSALAILSSLWLLPRMKGLLVAVQWAKRMHGFGRAA